MKRVLAIAALAILLGCSGSSETESSNYSTTPAAPALRQCEIDNTGTLTVYNSPGWGPATIYGPTNTATVQEFQTNTYSISAGQHNLRVWWILFSPCCKVKYYDVTIYQCQDTFLSI